MSTTEIMLKLADKARDAWRVVLDTPMHQYPKGRSDIATSHDVRIEDVLIAAIRDLVPGARVVAEESATQCDSWDGETWVVDSIDGTRNYSRGIPFFCTSIGQVHDGIPVMGCVVDPVRDETFIGGRGRALTINGCEPRREAVTKLSEAIVAISAVSSASSAGGTVSAMVEACQAVRLFGSTALSLAYVAVTCPPNPDPGL